MEKKYFFHGSKVVPIAFFLALFFLVAIWVWIGSLGESELIVVAGLFMPIPILLALVGVFFQLFVVPRLCYANLTGNSIVIFKGLPFPMYNYKYSEIKKVNFSGGRLKGIDTGSFMSNPIWVTLKNPEEFIKDFSEKYKKATGRQLIIDEKLFG